VTAPRAEAFGHYGQICKLLDPAVGCWQPISARKRCMSQLKILHVLHETETAKKEAKIVQLKNIELQQEIAERTQIAQALQESEQRFRALVEGALQGILVHRHTKPLYVNRAYAQILGYDSPDEILSLDSAVLLIAPHEQARLLSYHAARVTGEPAPNLYEYDAIRKDGSIVTLQHAVTMIPWDGEPAVLAIITDITERKRAEQALRAESSFRSAIVERAAEGICVCHEIAEFPYVAFTVWNERMTEITGYTMDAINRLGWYQCMYPDPEVQARAIARMARMRQGDDLRSEEWQITRADGEQRVLLLSTSVLQTTDGFVHVLALMHDVTERKRTEAALQASERYYRMLTESLTDFVVHLDRDGRIQYINRLAEGYTMDMVRGRHTLEFIAPESHQATIQALRTVLETGQPASFENFGQRTAATQGWYYTRLVPISDGTDITSVLLIATDITERKQAEEALKESEKRYRDLFENANDIIYTVDLEGTLTSINKRGELLTGYRRDEMVGMDIARVVPSEYRVLESDNLARKLAGAAESTVYELEIICKNGRRLPVEVSSRLIFEAGQPIGAQGIARDISERKHLEEQLGQAQKMDAIGRLAGGVAHDFNNLLTTIIGYSEVALAELAQDAPIRQDIEQVVAAGQRAAALTQQLLAFSRKQVLQPQLLNLNSVVIEMEKMLRRLIGEDIEILIDLNPALGPVKADPGQIEQVILNLAVNARDAMPRGGQLTIETANVDLDEAYARQHVDVAAGPYVMLAISDTGIGLDSEIQSHMFEPFFTTKGPGQGTGLGLTTVYGIVNQSSGHIWVYSEPDHGATFKIYLPRAEAPAESVKRDQVLTGTAHGSETILLVEDEDTVRELARRALLKQGYTVLEARSGAEAIQVCDQHPAPIHALVTDVVMPGGMSGPNLAERLLVLRPEMKVLYISGYTDDAIVHHGILDRGTNLLQKPFVSNTLVRKVREVLDVS
jgi:two-component system cell cycle sensor histidine kinase/response regulator CckA